MGKGATEPEGRSTPREVVEQITLVNAREAAYAQGGYIKESDVHQLIVDAVVDTGAGPLVIMEAMRQQLGLVLEKQDTWVIVAGGARQRSARGELVDIIWKDRCTSSRPIVLPGGHTLLGVIPLEDMDLLVNPIKRRLEGAHGAEWVRQVRYHKQG
jgi:hypothetical protein